MEARQARRHGGSRPPAVARSLLLCRLVMPLSCSCRSGVEPGRRSPAAGSRARWVGVSMFDAKFDTKRAGTFSVPALLSGVLQGVI